MSPYTSIVDLDPSWISFLELLRIPNRYKSGSIQLKVEKKRLMDKKALLSFRNFFFICNYFCIFFKDVKKVDDVSVCGRFQDLDLNTKSSTLL